MSGSLVYYTAKRSYTESNANAIINNVITGDAGAISGQMTMFLSTGDTSHCPGDYFAGWTVVDLSTGVSTFDSDGLRILPSPMGSS